MISEQKLRTALYNFFEEFNSRFEKKDISHNGVYKGLDNRLYTKQDIQKAFIEYLTTILKLDLNNMLGLNLNRLEFKE